MSKIEKLYLGMPDGKTAEVPLGGEDSLPVGTVLMWSSTTLPSSKWMVRKGDVLNKSDYPELSAILGNTYGGSDTTFALPDDRGLVERGWDNGRGLDSGRTFGSQQEDAIRNITGSMSLLSAIYDGSDHPGLYDSSVLYPSSDAELMEGQVIGTLGGNFSFDASRVVPTAAENRVRNRAYLPIIKVRP